MVKICGTLWHVRGSGKILGCVHRGCKQAGYGWGHFPVDGLVRTSRYISAVPKCCIGRLRMGSWLEIVYGLYVVLAIANVLPSYPAD